MTNEDGPPAPPCRFRCNRSRMVLTIQITLHHAGADHINLETSKNAIKLDTLKSRRKFKMNRAYPRGIECDDSKTTAKLEGGSLLVEMPITKLPVPPEELKKQAAAKEAAKAKAAAKLGKKTKKRKGDGGAEGASSSAAPPTKKRKQAAAEEDSDGDFDTGADVDDDDDVDEVATKGGKKQKKQAGNKPKGKRRRHLPTTVSRS